MGCVVALATPILLFAAIIMGEASRDSFTPGNVVTWLVAFLGILIVVGLQANKRLSHELPVIQQRRNQLNQLATKYNDKVRMASSSQYIFIQRNYNRERNSLKKTFEQEGKLKLTGFWQWLFAIGFVAIFFSGCFNLGLTENFEESSQATRLMDQRLWSADNIPMPHMHDHSLYVSNPDSILSQTVVDSINSTLGQLDDVLDIESVMVIVGHIENDDPVGMVRGIYDKYKVGRNDRGLVIVVGYLDHSYFIAPGRSLEGDLTDAECSQLARNYLIPSMKAEQPDSGGDTGLDERGKLRGRCAEVEAALSAGAAEMVVMIDDAGRGERAFKVDHVEFGQFHVQLGADGGDFAVQHEDIDDALVFGGVEVGVFQQQIVHDASLPLNGVIVSFKTSIIEKRRAVNAF